MIQQLIVFFRSKGNKIVKYTKIIEIIAFVFLFFTIFLSLTLEATRPFNYINIFCFGIFTICSLIYIILFGEFKFDFFVGLTLLFLLTQYIATIVNAIPAFTTTGTLIAFMSIFIYQFLKQFNYSKQMFLYIFTLAASLFIVFFLIRYFNDILNPNISNRIGTFFGNQNDVARNLSYSALSFMVLFFNSKKIYLKIISTCFTLLAFYFILLTGSISNSLVIFIVLAIYIFLTIDKKTRIIYIIGLVAFIVLIIVLLQLPSFAYFKNRILKMLNSFFGRMEGVVGSDSSFISRFRGAFFGLKLFLQNPLFGNGYSAVFRNYYIMSHNNIVEIAADFGIFALLLHEGLLFYPFAKTKNKPPEIYLILLFTVIFQVFLVSFDSKIDSMLLPFCYLFINDVPFLEMKGNQYIDKFLVIEI